MQENERKRKIAGGGRRPILSLSSDSEDHTISRYDRVLTGEELREMQDTFWDVYKEAPFASDTHSVNYRLVGLRKGRTGFYWPGLSMYLPRCCLRGSCSVHDSTSRGSASQVIMRPPSDNPEIDFAVSPRDSKSRGDLRNVRPSTGVLHLTEESSESSKKRPKAVECNLKECVFSRGVPPVPRQSRSEVHLETCTSSTTTSGWDKMIHDQYTQCKHVFGLTLRKSQESCSGERPTEKKPSQRHCKQRDASKQSSEKHRSQRQRPSPKEFGQEYFKQQDFKVRPPSKQQLSRNKFGHPEQQPFTLQRPSLQSARQQRTGCQSFRRQILRQQGPNGRDTRQKYFRHHRASQHSKRSEPWQGLLA
ncbi:hypothetical protein BIW11_08976 [Tropilaelaps mercedesae]|uniref:Uncharacterized protein n=1 Tax=Tropilaelaps mercedesae TaxID=418985 RepID=A0A1V9XM37_9ACAR|nr:hypothetical protein BIW11_08976 [Tropilaelaps mercedesae]